MLSINKYNGKKLNFQRERLPSGQKKGACNLANLHTPFKTSNADFSILIVFIRAFFMVLAATNLQC